MAVLLSVYLFACVLLSFPGRWDLDDSILELLRKCALTPDEVAKKLRVSWATANGAAYEV